MSVNDTFLIVQITAGQGPEECARAAFLLAQSMVKAALKQGLSAERVDEVPGRTAGTSISAVLSFSGTAAETFVAPWIGTVQWICESPYRPTHRRKNWFVGVSLLPSVSSQESEVRAEDISWKAVKASGPGGQHVNTTDSAVQALHRPSGIRVTSSEERSQHANKRRALQKIQAVLCAHSREAEEHRQKGQWARHNDLERGNPVKVFVGPGFKERRG